MSQPPPPEPSPNPPPLITPLPPANTLFVTKTFDEFTDVTTTTHISKLKYAKGGKAAATFGFQLMEFKGKDKEGLILRCVIESKDWHLIRKGKIIFNCDQENHEVEYHKSKTETKTKTVEDVSYTYHLDLGHYRLNPILLKQICDAKILKIRIIDEAIAEPNEKWCAEFQKYCRQFYNNAYDSSLYAEAVALEPKAETKSGCFVATAAMGSYDDPTVQVLTRFRDAILLRSMMGRQAVRFYYAVSPGVASWMRDKVWVCGLAKWLLVLPASKIVALMLKQNRCEGKK